MTRFVSIAFLAAILAFPSTAIAQTPAAKPESDSEPTDSDSGCVATLDVYLLDLQSKEHGARWMAADCLQHFNDPRAAEPLVRAILTEDSFRVRMQEVATLQQISNPRLIKMLIDGLETETTRSNAMAALGQMGALDAVPHIVKILQDGKREDRFLAVGVLSNMKDSRVLTALTTALHDRDVIVRRGAATSLGSLGNEDASNALIQALRDKDDGVRWNATVALGKLKSRNAVNGLSSVLMNVNERDEIRSCAADSLAQIGDSAAVPVLIASLNTLSVQWHAASALVHFNEPEAQGALEDGLRQGKYKIVAAAHTYFLSRTTPETIKILIAALTHEGYEKMAEDFISCGQPELVEAGRLWIAANPPVTVSD